MFRLPANLAVGQQYGAVSPEAVVALENWLPPSSRMLVGLVFAERYDGFVEDCQQAEAELRTQAGLSPWPELGCFITPDPDGEPIAWVSYISSPAWWTLILLLLGGIFLLPILAALPLKIVDWLFPGTMELISSMVILGIMVGVMMFMPKMTGDKK
ncbi:MAG: hypothetical protein PHQ43_12210 [Dehalococcoidales bacterium]|nr:hypothetical protein [Dehalococcoidales bacterium]